MQQSATRLRQALQCQLEHLKRLFHERRVAYSTLLPVSEQSPGTVLRTCRNCALVAAAAAAAVLLLVLLAPTAGAQQVKCYGSLARHAFPWCQQLSPMYALHWSIHNRTITIGIEAAAGDGWVGFGLSDTGSMKGADITAITKAADGTWQAVDMHATGFQRPLPDPEQDVALLSAHSAAGTTVAVFRRPLVSCDAAHDPGFEEGTPQIVIWAIGQQPQLSYHGDIRGSAQVNFRPSPQHSDSSKATAATAHAGAPVSMNVAAAGSEPVRTINVTYDKQAVPGRETTYMCKYVQLPHDTKYHAIAYTGIITSQFLHHMVLYRCAGAPMGVSAAVAAGQPFDCTNDGIPCMEYAMVWAPGTPNTVFPPEAGLPFGENQQTSWFVLNAHYNNPDGIEGGIDSSGFSINYTTALRPHDMGVLTLGTTNVAIPPGIASFEAPPSTCSSACTRRFPGPLNLWANYLHMHQIGDAIQTQLLRPVNKSSRVLQELQPTGIIRSYSFDFQKGTPVPPASSILLPGDELVTTCRYDSRTRASTTLEGLGSRDEMCYNFLFYYPRMTGFSSCVSHSNFTLCGDEVTAISTIDFRSEASVRAAIASGLLVPDSGAPPRHIPYKGPPCTHVQQPR